VNVAGLLFARAAGRARELAVRTALGASRGPGGRVLLAESALLAAMGAGLGVLCAAWAVDVIAALTPAAVAAAGGASRGAQLDSFATADVDWRVVAFAGALAVVAGLLAGLPPALRATRGDLTAALAAGARGASARVGSARRPTVLSTLVMAEVAVAVVLLAGAGLLLKNFAQLRAVRPGVDAAAVLTFRISPPEGRYGGGRAAGPLLERVLERVAAVPGVTAATVGRCTPYADGCSSTALYVAGRPAPPAGAEPIVGRHYVGPDHFRVLGIPVVRGRAFTPADRPGRPKVAVVNGAAARRFWPGDDPIGKRVWFGSGPGLDSPDSTAEVVGVVADVPYGAPGEPVGPDVYTSYLQFTWPETMVMVRAATPAAALVPALRRAVAAADPGLPVYDVRTVEERAGAALAVERFSTTLLGAFGLLGLALAGLGVYGVMAFSVAQRRREIGIRLALGATRAAAVRLVVGEGAALAGVGLAVGSAAAVALTRTLAALLTGVSPTDPLVFAAVLAALALVALGACVVPAGRAATVPPATALASE
jgi:putative ABC transport system permease protein